MTDLSLSQSFALIALNAQYSLRMTVAKKTALRCLAAAVVLETCLESGFLPGGGLPVRKWKELAQSGNSFQKVVFQPLARRKFAGNQVLGPCLKKASALSRGKLVRLEHAMADSLKSLGLLDETPSLLGCDLYNFSNGISIRNYRSSHEEFTRVTESLRAETLEDGTASDEIICLLWLLRESGCTYDLFSQNELEKAAARMYEFYRTVPLAKEIYPVKVHRGIELAAKQLLHSKKSAFRTSFGGGVVFAFPVLERSRSVFIDTDAWFENADKRLDDIVERLKANGNSFEVLAGGPIPILRIDNTIYHGIPQAVMVNRLPVHGVRLLPQPPV